MTKEQAIRKAAARAKATDTEVYVVFDGQDDGYQVASLFDTDTFYLGCPVECSVDAGGEVWR
jgi:hypothetical protein